MKTAIRLLTVVLSLALAATAVAGPKNPDTFIKASASTIRTLDPAAAYDMASMQKVENIYDKLIAFDGPNLDKFIPVLATEVPSLANGGISADGTTYTFTVRKGVKFEKGGDLTASDVAYSIQRVMVLDQSGGPAWMLLEALTGEGSTTDKDGKLKAGIMEKILASVSAEGERVVFRLPRPYPPFMGIMAKSWASVVDKEWVIEQGGWDGRLANAADYNSPAPGKETLHKICNGSGPYKLAHWDPSAQFVFERNGAYWGAAPKLNRAVFKYVPEWSTRKLMLQNGDVDSATVDDQYVAEASAMKGVKSYKIPQLAVSVAMFCRKIDPTGNPYIGSGKLDGAGIPIDFFADIHVRRAFWHCFDSEIYAKDVLQGISVVPSNPIVQGLPHAVKTPVYAFDLEKAAESMKRAWGGEVWQKGFKMTILHNTGNAMREAAAHMLAENVMRLNPKFQVEVAHMSWRDYLSAYRQFRFPIAVISWVADYPDPHNFAHPFMHSEGSHGRYMGSPSPETDKLVEAGVATTDPAKRAEIYAQLSSRWYEEAMGIPVYQSTEMRFYREWVHGFVGNPLDAGDTEWLWRLHKQ
ncbi:MAG: ABC transporter substrate-binding protein [Desulfosarcinaceae bacterium]|nr:ABC transporter substrate-binding protein [Desulfosarcinaceae bacterium]